MTTIKKITVAGSGVLGSQIAFQSALHGYDVTIYDINGEAIEKSKKLIDTFLPRYKSDLQISSEKLEEAYQKLQFSINLHDAVSDADLLIEAIPESIGIKKEFYRNLSKIAPEKTIFATNTSTLLPSLLMDETGRPEKFLALHFANEIWKHNTAEIMGTEKTNPEVFETLVEFAKSIGMIALPLKKEQPGYILNTLLVPLLSSGILLYAKGVADIETIDKTWMLGTGSPIGPFGILDVVGLGTVYHIFKTEAERTGNEEKMKFVNVLKNQFIDAGKLGVSSGEGFYKYPNPTFQGKDFLK